MEAEFYDRVQFVVNRSVNIGRRRRRRRFVVGKTWYDRTLPR